jgi:ABC-type multidrug transport system permease subunit
MSDQNQEQEQTSLTTSQIVLGVFGIIWILAGIIAIIMSIVCFGFSGSTSEKTIGLLLAFFLGPLYFIFYGVNKGYCRNLGANVIATVTGGRK